MCFQGETLMFLWSQRLYGLLLSFVLALSLLATTARGSEPAPSAVTVIGHVPYGHCEHVIADGDTVYAASGCTLQMISFARPEAPQLLSEFVVPYAIKGLSLYENTIYVAAGLDGVRSVDVSDPSHPIQLAHVTGKRTAVSVAADREFVMVTGKCGVVYLRKPINDKQNLDVAYASPFDNPDAAELLGEWSYFVDYDVITARSHARAGESGSKSYEFELEGIEDWPIEDIEVAPGLLYAVSKELGLTVLATNNNTSFSLVGTAKTGGWPVGVVANGDLVYVADRSSGLVTFDCSDPQNPEKIGEISTPGVCYAADLAGSRAYIADGSAVRAYYADEEKTFVEIGEFPARGDIQGIHVSGNTAIVHYFGYGLGVISLWAYSCH
jgi:hypothetical protein